METDIKLTDGELLDVCEALNGRISATREAADRAELGYFSGLSTALHGRVVRLEALRHKLLERRSGR